MDGWDLGPADPLQWICREWVQELGFDETTINAKVRDDRVGTKNIELDGLTIRGKELLVRGYEFSYGLIHQEHDGGICAPPPREQNPAPLPCGRSLTLYSSLWSILVLHLLVIHAYTWVHIPSATPSNVLWAVMTQIALSRGHVHINGARMLAVGI